MVFIGEEPLSIRVQGSPYAVVMRTPGEEKAHVAGFCLGEGIVDNPGDITNIAFCDGEDTNVVTVTLTATRRTQIADHLDRRTYISQTSCGICGKSIVADLVQALSAVADGEPLNGKGALDRLLHLSDYQPLRDKTRAAHGAAIYDHAFNQLSVAEDVGRHNALDKAIGRLFCRWTAAAGAPADPLVTHQLRTGPESSSGKDSRHPGHFPAHCPGRRTGHGPEHYPGVAGQGRQSHDLLQSPASRLAALNHIVYRF